MTSDEMTDIASTIEQLKSAMNYLPAEIRADVSIAITTNSGLVGHIVGINGYLSFQTTPEFLAYEAPKEIEDEK